MRTQKKALGLLLLVCLSGLSCSALDAAGIKDEAKEAFQGIKDKIDSIQNNAIVKKVLVYADVIAFTAIAVKHTVALIQSLMGGPKESKELVFMREQFAIINTKLDALDYEFRDVKNQIDWSVTKVNVGAYERSIRSLETIFQNYLNAPSGASEFFQDIFMKAYVRTYNDAATKIYVALAKESAIFQDNLFKIARKQLKDDKQKISDFTGYILRVINRGITLEHAFLLASGRGQQQEALKKDWADRFAKLAVFAEKVEKDVINAWSSQFKIDSDEFAVRNAQLSNRDMTNNLHKFLSKKYPWKWWFVFVYTFTNHNDKDRFFQQCGHSFVKYNVGNKVVIVIGLEEHYKPKPNPKWFLISTPSRLSGFGAYAKLAKEVYNRSSSGCHLYNFKGVFESKASISYLGPKGRMFGKHVELLRSFHGYKGYEMFMLV